MKMAGRVILCSVLLLALAACQRGANIEISRTRAGVPVFKITASDKGPSCIHYVSVAEVTVIGDSIVEGARIWAIRQSPGDACRSEFEFGMTPPGYVEMHPESQALVAGTTYRVSVSSNGGINAGKTFTFEGEK